MVCCGSLTIGLELLILENFGDSGSETIYHLVCLEYDPEKHVINYNYNNIQLLRSPNNSLFLQCSVNITTCTMYHYGDLSYGYYNPRASEVKQILLAILGGNKPPPQLQLHTTPSIKVTNHPLSLKLDLNLNCSRSVINYHQKAGERLGSYWHNFFNYTSMYSDSLLKCM